MAVAVLQILLSRFARNRFLPDRRTPIHKHGRNQNEFGFGFNWTPTLSAVPERIDVPRLGSLSRNLPRTGTDESTAEAANMEKLYIAELAFAGIILLNSMASTSQQPPNDSDTVVLSGCVAAGLKPDCLILRDAATRKLYLLLWNKQPKPTPGKHISVTVRLEKARDLRCAEGIPATVVSWRGEQGECCSNGLPANGSRCALPDPSSQFLGKCH